MKRMTIVAVISCSAFVFGVGGYMKGRNDVWLSEFKTYQGNLVVLGLQPRSPDLREFLKGRYYYLANRIPASWLGTPYDYGPIATNMTNLFVGKGPTTAQYEYQLFKEKPLTFKQPAKQP